MDTSSIYADIAARTGGNIYIGVVGPVRTGKSTFIKRFMETLVLPNITDDYVRERARDELPQSGSGRKKQIKSKAAIRNCTHSFAQRVQLFYRKTSNGRSRAQPLRSWGIERGPFFR